MFGKIRQCKHRPVNATKLYLHFGHFCRRCHFVFKFLICFVLFCFVLFSFFFMKMNLL